MTARIGHFLDYLLFLVHFGHKIAKCHAYHKGCDNWKVTRFCRGDAGWDSDHLVTCSKCDYEYTAKRFWPRLINTEESAKTKAYAYRGET